MKNSFIHFLNGEFVTEENLLISPRDLGFARGYAVSDFLVTHNFRPFKLSGHIDRLFMSAEAIGIKIPWSKEQIAKWIQETLDKNDKNLEKTIKIFLTGGKSHFLFQTSDPTIIIIVGEYIHQSAKYYEKGVKAKLVKYGRQFADVKTTNDVEAIRNLSKLRNSDVTEVIYYDNAQIYEGGGCNIFAVIDDKLLTPKSNILEGVTRNILLGILKLDIPVEIKDFSINDLFNASEIFLTGSSKEIRGVVRIDEKQIGDGKVGEITKEVMRQYKEYTSKN